MKATLFGVSLVVLILCALPAAGFAQEATVVGTVTDATGGVLPGATVQAVHEATGNVFEAVTDERGTYRLPVRVGGFRITAQLAGFTTVTRTGVQLLVGQQVVMNFEMAVSAVAESVTVTAEAPLIDLNSSTVANNVDPRQVSELPLYGRNWMQLTMLVPGSRTNAVGENPVAIRTQDTGTFQLNVDGQQVTQTIRNAQDNPNPRFSQDAIAEFEFVANRFDATQGRSMGVQVNVITKSGTNTHAGSLSGYFRSDRFNAADHVVNHVLPYSNQQVSATYGGPIQRDRIHYFANYEFEREPLTESYSSPIPAFNVDTSGTRREHKAGQRVDFQLSPRTRLTVRGAEWRWFHPLADPGGTPSQSTTKWQWSNQLFGALPKVVSNRIVNELRAGYNNVGWAEGSNLRNPGAHAPGRRGSGYGATGVQFSSFTVGPAQNSPQDFDVQLYSIRDDFTLSSSRHTLKSGGEYFYQQIDQVVCRSCFGFIDARGARVPANVADLFPSMFDASNWNVAAVSSLARLATVGVGRFDYSTWKQVLGFWIQDDWAIAPRLTLNLGLRYDVELHAVANEIELGPFLRGDRPDDKDNWAPRVGFAFRPVDRTVIRGGAGRYYGTQQNPHPVVGFSIAEVVQVPNNGRPDFAVNPFNGPTPALEEVRARSGFQRSITTGIHSPYAVIQHTDQASIGVQRQIGNAMAVEADYVYNRRRREIDTININLSYNPATGANYPFSDVSRLPYPGWGRISMLVPFGYSNYHGLQMGFAKRFSSRWQASASYLFSGFRDANARPLSGIDQVPFPLGRDFGGEYTLAATDQRHRAVFNGIWDVGYGFQLSGLYFHGSGYRYSTNYGGDLRQALVGSARLRPDGTIVDRNSFVGRPLHRVDLRLLRRFRLGGARQVEGILDVFNVFDHANFGSYGTSENNPAFYRRPTFNGDVAYGPRAAQLGFRFTF
ncbi:MAG: TonB-dependent receptor [Acidobacteria bacterium]|nr:TonB-dependent receptor [Acidobacteriota bacterium]